MEVDFQKDDENNNDEKNDEKKIEEEKPKPKDTPTFDPKLYILKTTHERIKKKSTRKR